MFGAAGFAILVWSATLIVTKLVVRDVDGVAVGALRTVLPALVVAPLAVLGRMPPPSSWRERRLLFASTLGGYVLFPTLFSTGLRFTDGAHAALIMAAAPVFTGLIAALLEWRRPRPLWLVGVVLALAGEVLLVVTRQDIGRGAWLGDLLIGGACLAAAAGYVTGARLGQSFGSWPATCWGILLGAFIFAPMLPYLLSSAGLGDAGAMAWCGILYLGAFSSLLAYIAWYWALGRGGIARIGALQFLQPVLALILAVLIFGDRLGTAAIVAAGCIFAGVLLTQRA